MILIAALQLKERLIKKGAYARIFFKRESIFSRIRIAYCLK